MNIVVCLKQVPDTNEVRIDPKTGTLIREGVPSIINPDDKNALEEALVLKEQHGAHVTVISMGPPQAESALREALAMGADEAVLITDRAFAGSDTLATSYALSQAIKEMGAFDLIIAGRQAIDGDTAQVGPQVAEKLGLFQVTYVEEILKVEKANITVRRRLDNGVETVKAPLPLLLTVNSSAPDCRSRNAKLLMKYKHARTVTERQAATEDYLYLYDSRPFLNIHEMTVNEIKSEADQLGLLGSPTKVKRIENVILQAKDAKKLTAADKGINDLMKELIDSHVIG